MSAYNKCIRDVASTKGKSLATLFDTIEQEVNAKVEFIQGQKHQFKAMQEEIETLIEWRYVVE